MTADQFIKDTQHTSSAVEHGHTPKETAELQRQKYQGQGQAYYQPGKKIIITT